MVNKITKREVLEMIRGIAKDNEVIQNYVAHEIELLDRKRASSGQSATQIANVEVKNKILNALIKIAEPVTITELQARATELAEYSNQKISALLSQMNIKNGGKIDKMKDKKATKFFVVKD